MPELPEVEHLRRTLEPLLIGSRIEVVSLSRKDVLSVNGQNGSLRSTRAALLHGTHIDGLVRHGKQLAMIADDGRTLCVHLGMSGQMRFVDFGTRLESSKHVHCIWRIKNNRQCGRLIFRDPRRFGGLWAFKSTHELNQMRWNLLGPDALNISARTLQDQLSRTKRAIKAALLDQSVLAGIGNIYADEALFRSRVHPLATAQQLERSVVNKLARAIRDVLRCAIKAGGTTLRDYADGNGEAGRFAQRHAVYGRTTLPCRRCGETLQRIPVAQRSTVYCRHCQHASLIGSQVSR